MKKEQSEKMVKKLLAKRESDRIRKTVEPIIGGSNERPGRSDPTITQRQPKEAPPALEGAREDFEGGCIEGKSGRDNPPPILEEANLDKLEPGEGLFKIMPVGPAEIHLNTGELPEMPPVEELTTPAVNQAARERLERQISALMAKVNQSLTDFHNATKDALDVLEMARSSVYTEPLGEVGVNIHEAARRFPEHFSRDSRVLNRLANVALEIRQSEEKKKEK